MTLPSTPAPKRGRRACDAGVSPDYTFSSTPMSNEESRFPDRLRAARELRKLSQGDLAGRTGLQPSAISHFETGRRSPSFENLRRLADALQVTTDFLLGRSDEPEVAGTVAQQMFRDADQLSSEDLEAAAEMIQFFKKRRDREKGES